MMSAAAASAASAAAAPQANAPSTRSSSTTPMLLDDAAAMHAGASSSASRTFKSPGAAAAASAAANVSSSRPSPVVPWESLPAVEQLCALTGEELQESIVRSWFRDASFIAKVHSLSAADLARVGPLLKVVDRNAQGMRSDLCKLITKWARDNPNWALSDEEAAAESVEDVKAVARQLRRSQRPRSKSPAPPVVSAPLEPRKKKSAAKSSAPAGVSAAVLSALEQLPSISPHSSPRRARSVSPAPRGAPAPIIARPQEFLHRALQFQPDADSDSADDDDALDPLGAAVPLTSRAQKLNVAVNMESLGLASPFAESFLSNVLRGAPDSTVQKVYKYDISFNHTRNQRECLTLAALIDAARAGDLNQVLELACRRLAGVHTADASNNWKICDAIELHTASQSFVPSGYLQLALKQVVRMQAVEKTSSAPRGAGSGVPGGPKIEYKKKKASFGAGGYTQQSKDKSGAAGSGTK